MSGVGGNGPAANTAGPEGTGNRTRSRTNQIITAIGQNHDSRVNTGRVIVAMNGGPPAANTHRANSGGAVKGHAKVGTKARAAMTGNREKPARVAENTRENAVIPAAHSRRIVRGVGRKVTADVNRCAATSSAAVRNIMASKGVPGQAVSFARAAKSGRPADTSKAPGCAADLVGMDPNRNMVTTVPSASAGMTREADLNLAAGQ